MATHWLKLLCRFKVVNELDERSTAYVRYNSPDRVIRFPERVANEGESVLLNRLIHVRIGRITRLSEPSLSLIPDGVA